MAASAGPEIERLIALLAKLPGLGPRSARRAALALLKKREQLLEPLAASLAETAAKVVSCSVCGAPDTRDPCSICSDPSRDNALICVVEEAGSLWAMERSGAFRGKSQVLGIAVAPDPPRQLGQHADRGDGGRDRRDHLPRPWRPGRRRPRLARRRHHRPGASGATTGVI